MSGYPSMQASCIGDLPYDQDGAATTAELVVEWRLETRSRQESSSQQLVVCSLQSVDQIMMGEYMQVAARYPLVEAVWQV